MTWDFLAPNRAHNRCDAAAAHFKQKINSFIKDYFSLSQISHLAFAAATLKNSYFVEVSEFPVVIECAAKETFMRDSFRFEYGDAELRVDQCNHPCYGTNCAHPCCNRKDEIEMVCLLLSLNGLFSHFQIDIFATNREGERLKHTLRSVNYCSREAEDKNNASSGGFWDTANDRLRLIPKSVIRVAQVENDDNFEWDNVTYDDDHADGDFCG